uniref:DNA-directed RNA polymerase subunit beta' n=1 Tax=Interfilum terricola TaxID=163310 RepID=A0A097KPL4_9VIRI|nr:beta' subunit of RNA polymerase [Interfilum terricola]AIT95126.1 beta' subunit of RNA polymerase [Interfilum terricola]
MKKIQKGYYSVKSIKKNTSLKPIQVESIRIGLASPERIRKWAERTLPNGKIIGQVTNSQTVNYKTLKPEKGGLFCERVFGPIKDFECACGKKRIKYYQKFCPDCDVEFTHSRVRRHRLGFIQLVSSVTHIWYLKGTPSYISILLDLPKKKIEAITYCTETLYISPIKLKESDDIKKLQIKQIKNINRSKAFPSLSFSLLSKESKEKKTNYQESSLPSLKREEESPLVKIFSEDTENTLHTKTKGSDDKKMILEEQRNSKSVQTSQSKTVALPSLEKDRMTSSNLGKLKNDIQKVNEDNQILKQFEQEQNSSLNLVNFKNEEFCLKKNLMNTYYVISQDCSWEMQDDWNFFNYYITNPPFKDDKLIFSYNSKILNFDHLILSKTKLNNFLTGGEAIRLLLSNLDLALLDRQLRMELFEYNEQINEFENQNFLLFGEQRRLQFLYYIRTKKLRRLKLIRHFRRTKAQPDWMILSILPVLPPDLRPIIQLDGDQVAVSDLNKLYQKVLFRNNRMKRHRKINSGNKSDEIKYAQRLLQESIDALIENGKGGSEPICASNDRPLKSLSDMLKGKKGRFRQNLLGKRVDYSGRSVIVVGPKLKLHECGLPKEMAIELFQPFLIRKLMANKIVRTIVGAKRLINNQDSIIWEILRQVMQNHPVLLNRAPTLHRLGIQAFQPKLVEGRAILLHPLVCPAFNADFDGDQMAVHVPLSFQARAEAWKLMWSRNNLLSPATGQPIILPSQDMVLGCYYLTTFNDKFPNLGIKNKFFYFSDLNDVLKAYNQKKIHLHASIWVRWNYFLESFFEVEKPLEIRVYSNGNFLKIYSSFQRYFESTKALNFQLIRTTPGRVLVNDLLQKFYSKS